jgi:hypothetical protein
MKKLYSASIIVGVTALFAFADAPTTFVPAGWTAITTAAWIGSLGNQTDGYGGVSAVRVNRLTGDLFIDASGYGIWKSTNKGTSYTRLDGTLLSGRCENSSGAFQIDQNNPVRMAVFSLDGTGGYTANGTTWTKINPSAGSGRGWDFGSVDWATQAAKVMFAAAHESGGQNALSTDGGNTWKMLSAGFGGNANSGNEFGLGVMDATTLIYSAGAGIKRSVDLGNNWTQVTSLNSSIRIPVLFNGKHYLGETKLLVSADKGATWTQQGAALPGGDKMWSGPWFGADENTMVVAGVNNIYKTTNGGTAWTTLSTTPNNQDFYSLNPNWFGCETWDPINNVLYATAMNCYGYKKDLGPVSVMQQSALASKVGEMTVVNSTIHFNVPFNTIELYTLSGNLVSRQHLVPSYSAALPSIAKMMQTPVICKITTVQGATHQRLVTK